MDEIKARARAYLAARGLTWNPDNTLIGDKTRIFERLARIDVNSQGQFYLAGGGGFYGIAQAERFAEEIGQILTILHGLATIHPDLVQP